VTWSNPINYLFFGVLTFQLNSGGLWNNFKGIKKSMWVREKKSKGSSLPLGFLDATGCNANLTEKIGA